MRTFTRLCLSLSFLLTATATAARAGVLSDHVTEAATACRSDAAQLRELAADCRAHSTPPDDGGEYCTGITYSETTPDGQVHDYELSPDEAESIADQFDGEAPALETAARDVSDREDAIATTHDKIAELGFDKDAADYAAWMDLAESSREELAKETRKFLIARALDTPEHLEHGLASLSRGRAAAAAEKLAVFGEAGREVGALLKRTARLTGRRAKAEEAAKAIKGLHALADMAASDEQLDALASGLTYFVELDGFGFLVDELKWTTAAAYAYEANTVSEARIDQLADLQAIKLRALASLTRLLERQVKDLRETAGSLHGCSYARPSV